MLKDIKKNNILFLDIETVPAYSSYSELSDKMKELWAKKMEYTSQKEELDAEELYERAGIYAEFGKIVCISVGFFYSKAGKTKFRIKSFAGDDEKKLIKGFNDLLDQAFYTNDHYLCGHNGKEFDFPYIARRSLINGLKLPVLLDIAGKKPWEIKHLDTMELWKFGDYKHYTSIALLTEIFSIPTPKDDIDGSDVGRVYWEEKSLSRIVEYCQKDVLAVAQLYLRYKGEKLIDNEDVEIVN
jgi:uncharacterized protein YprB with RNaseH-like and TPR domain